jgi:hypothetical protein
MRYGPVHRTRLGAMGKCTKVDYALLAIVHSLFLCSGPVRRVRLCPRGQRIGYSYVLWARVQSPIMPYRGQCVGGTVMRCGPVRIVMGQRAEVGYALMAMGQCV